MTLSIVRFRGLHVALTVAAVLVGLGINDHAMAQVYGGPGLQGGLSILTGGGLGITSTTSLRELIFKIITFLLDIVLILAILAVIVAGIYLIASNGDDGQKDKAKKIIYYVAAGIILILMARVIVLIVNHIFG